MSTELQSLFVLSDSIIFKVDATNTDRTVLIIISIATGVRLVLASLLELGNDEVYYWTYASYPALSHFDHPLMVGVLAQLFTDNLFFKDDFYLRLGPIMLAAVSSWFIYRIATMLKNEKAGLIAVLLFSSSIYCSIIGGFALTPDAPEIYFWLISLYFILSALGTGEITKKEKTEIILFGISGGLAMLSKYHGVFLWVGVILFIVFINREWFREPSLYLAMGVSLIIISPIAIWNYQNQFISFTFHGDRVTPSWTLRPDYFFRELAGQFAYHNPLNVILIIPALISLLKGQTRMAKNYKYLLLFTSIPLWLVFTCFALFRSTFPHWTGPAFISLIIIAADFWADRTEKDLTKFSVPLKFRLPSYFLLTLLIVAVYLINYSPSRFGKTDSPQTLGKGDFTQDMYGWEELGKQFIKVARREEREHKMKMHSNIIAHKWYPAAHEDFYIAQAADRKLFGIGTLSDLHKYAWINRQRGGLKKGADYYYIALSNYYRDPFTSFGKYFDRIEPIDTIQVERNGTIMRNAFVFRMKNYNGSFADPLP